jgi:rhodanese-related sulfurtransferase
MTHSSTLRPDSGRSIPATEAWARVQRGEAEILDLRTTLERRRYGWPPGARQVSLRRHALHPGGPDTIYLCQHARRSKLTLHQGAAEIANGWNGWLNAELPIQHE